MAGIFSAPRNSGTLCKLYHKITSACLPLLIPSITQSSVVRKSVVPTFETKMVLTQSSRFLRFGSLTALSAVLATQAIANIVKSSFGPAGLDKMMVDDIGDVTVTNDGATILSLLDVDHPAGKILVQLAQQQDKEVRQVDANLGDY